MGQANRTLRLFREKKRTRDRCGQDNSSTPNNTPQRNNTPENCTPNNTPE
jgi:hypothetical protein